MKPCSELFDKFWFAPAPAERLAVVRILVGSFVLQYLGRRIEMLTQLEGTEASMFKPVGLAHFLGEPISPELWQVSCGALSP